MLYVRPVLAKSDYLFFHEQQSIPHPTLSNQVHLHLLTKFCLLLLFLFYVVTSDPMPPNLPAHLQHARQLLVNELPPEHDLRKRVKHDGNGELLPEQPAGRPRVPPREPTPRKRGRDLSDPSMVLERRYLMTMWNDQYHLKEEWDRVHDKMSENRKKLGMRERPCKESDSRKRSRQGSPDSSSDRNIHTTASASKKRRKTDRGAGAARERSSDEGPTRQTRDRAPEMRIWDKVACQALSAFRRDRKTAKQSHNFLASSSWEPNGYKSHHSTSIEPQEDRSLSQSPFTTPSDVTKRSDRPYMASDLRPSALFPAVAEVLGAIPASGISMRTITGLFWERVHCDMDKFYMLLHENTNIDVDESLIRRKGGVFGNGPANGTRADSDNTCAIGQDSVPGSIVMSTDSITSGFLHYMYGTAAQTATVGSGIRLLARRGGLESTRNGPCFTAKMKKGRSRADDLHL